MEKSYSRQSQKEYHHELNRRKSKTIKVLTVITVIFAIGAALSYTNQAEDLLYIFFWVFLGIFGMFLLILILVSLFFVSEKPLYQFLYPKIVDDHNYEENSYITYNDYPKDKEFLNFGMLYPRGASKTLRFHLSFESSHGYHIDVYDAYIYTSSNNSNHIYLNGYYFVVRDYGPDVFQIRTHNGSYFRPKLKKLSNMTDMRVYVPEEKDSIDPKYIKFYQRIKEEFRSPSMVLGGNGNDLHIGVTLRPMRRTLKELNDRSYLQLRNSLVQLVDLANIIDNKDDSDNEW